MITITNQGTNAATITQVDLTDDAARLLGIATAQPGVDIGDVTVNNAAANPVPASGFLERVEAILTLDTNIYATNDLLADTQEIASAFVNSHPVALFDLRIVDEDDQGTAVDIYLLRSNTSLGTENNAFAPTDAMSREMLKRIVIAAGDWYDEGAFRVASKALPDGIGCILKPTAGTSLYIAAVCRSGTPTYTANGIRVQLGLVQAG
jgi:hypothetical protein